MITGKTIALTRQTFVGKEMSLLFNMLSRLVIAFLPRSKGFFFLISWLQSPSAGILEPKKIVSYCFHCFPIYLPWSDGKDSDAGRDWGQEEKGRTEDEMAGWYHQLYGHEFEWTLGVGDGQGGLVCCNSWGRKELDTTEQLNSLTDESRCHDLSFLNVVF